MSQWNSLYSRMKSLEAERLEAERQRRSVEAARAEHDAWARTALLDFWERLLRDVQRRAEEFRKQTGCPVEVVSRGGEPQRPADLPSLQVLELRLATSVVYLYTHHASGSAPLVHLAHWPTAEAGHRHHHRMMSFPMCSLDRVDEAGWRLRQLLGAREPATVDDLVYRAFELLVLGLERPEQSRLAAKAPA